MGSLDSLAAAVAAAEDGSPALSSTASAFLAELARQLQQAAGPEAVHDALTRAQHLWSPRTPGAQVVLERVSWDLLSVVGLYAARSPECQAAVASICQELPQACGPREAVTILLAALGCQSEYEARSWALQLSLVQGLAQALPLVQRRRSETFQQAAPAVLASLRAVVDPLEAAIAVAGGGDRWAAAELPKAMLELTQRVLDSCQPGEDALKHVVARFLLQILSIATSDVPMAPPSINGSSPARVDERIAAALLLLPRSDLHLHDLLDPRGNLEGGAGRSGDCPGSAFVAGRPAPDSDDEVDFESQEQAEVQQGRALAACYLLCLPPASLSPLPPPLSARDRPAAVALAGHLLQGGPVLGSKGLALLSAAAATQPSSGEGEGPLERDAVDGVQATLQSLSLLMLMLPDPRARQAMYAAFKAGLSVLPRSDRLFTLDRFIRTCPHQPVVSLLLHLLKEEVARALPLPSASTPVPPAPGGAFAGERILDVVGHVLSPTGRDGPPLPQLPQEADAVVAALNLYRFVLLREAAVGRSWTCALSHDALVRARAQWLLPLQQVAAEAAATAKQEAGGDQTHAACSPHPHQPGQPAGPPPDLLLIEAVQGVLHRVLDIVEERLENQ